MTPSVRLFIAEEPSALCANEAGANVTLGIGAAALVGGEILLLWEEMHPSEKSPCGMLEVSPTPGNTIVGIGGVL
jgi:hypothetical protein